MLVLLDTGIRASELTALKMRDYEPKRGQLIIHHGKGDKKRGRLPRHSSQAGAVALPGHPTGRQAG